MEFTDREKAIIRNLLGWVRFQLSEYNEDNVDNVVEAEIEKIMQKLLGR